ncbi:MAG TPA: redoxin family protein, partial [Oscillatoriaceae cyanobacterium]
VMLSGFRHREFAERYGLTMVDGPIAGLMSRAVVVIDPAGKVVYTEQVSEIGQEPNYEKALGALTVAR